MSSANTVKVVKGKERESRQDAARPLESARSTAQNTSRSAVATVTSWVKEFQERRRGETVQAVRSLLRNTQEPTEA
jgi:hypothetical protein